MKTPLVSVIVPIYNVEKYLKKCIESIIRQTYQQLEIILVDDGSTDSSPQICDEFLKLDDRIKVIHKKNGGLSDARNAGLDIAKGDYYAFIDSDDYISIDNIETLLNAVRKEACEIAVCNIIQFTENGHQKPFYCPVENQTVYHGKDRYITLNQPSVCNKLFKAELFEGIRFPKGKYYEDTFVYHELLYRANSVVLTGANGYWYLTREGSILGRPQFTVRYFDFVEAVWERANFLLKMDIQPYAYEACLSLYAAHANVEKYISKKNIPGAIVKKEKEQFEFAYQALMRREANTNFKQKLRLILLRYMPKLHSRLY